MSKVNLLKGLASLFKSKGKEVGKTTLPDTTSNVQNVFSRNLIDEFGADEVSEALRIIDKADADPQLSKLFYREGESKMDELVNLLESRYMSSDRLQTHPLHFKRRGSGSADRYATVNDSGSRLVDLPGGPGDKVLYGKFYGDMSKTTLRGGKKVYDKSPGILDEGTKLSDEGQTIEGVAKAVDDDLLLDPELFKEGQKAVKDLQKAGVMDETGGIPVGKVMDDMIAETINPEDAILKNMKSMERQAKEMQKQTEAMAEFTKRDQQQLTGAIDTFNRMLDAGDDPAEALQFLKDTMKRTKNASGGRVGMFLGGPLIGKGIMEAAKLAQKGIKPFGQKQTYKQNVKTVGMDKFQEGMKKQFDIELYKIDKVRGGNPEEELFDLYEDIVAGKRYSMLPEATKSKMISQIEDSMKAMEVDGGDYQNFRRYLQDQYGFADPTGIASGPGIDRFPNFPAGTGLEALQKGIDKGQIKTMKADDLMKALKNIEDRESGANVIPFKPREKKAYGGISGLLKNLLMKGGMKAADKIADKKQIQNVIRNPNTDLERIYKDRPSTGTTATPRDRMTIDEIRDMIQNDPRYNKLTAAQMDDVVVKETIRADFAYNKGIKPEEVDDDIVEMLFMENYQNRFGFQVGGVANPNLRKGADNPNLRQGMLPEEIEEEKKLLEAQLMDPSYNSVTGEYSVGGGLKIGPLQLEAMARGMEGIDPIMQYEGSLDLGNDLMLKGGYYDDAIMEQGMMSPDDEMRLSLTKSFANGGTVPPQKGPMSKGMGTLYRSK